MNALGARVCRVTEGVPIHSTVSCIEIHVNHVHMYERLCWSALRMCTCVSIGAPVPTEHGGQKSAFGQWYGEAEREEKRVRECARASAGIHT